MASRFIVALCSLIVAVPNLAVLERLWVVIAAPRLTNAIGPNLSEGLRVLLLASYLLGIVWILPKLARWLSAVFNRNPSLPLRWTSGLILVSLLLTVLVYPQVDSGRFGFYSDRDEALDVGGRELVSGNNPYRCRVISGDHSACLESGNPIGPLPGALLLASPFVLLFGMSALQTPLWLALWLKLSRRVAGSWSPTAAWTTALFVCAPIILAEILTGGDLLANALWVTTGVLLLARRPRLDGRAWLASALLGLLLCGRSNFVLVLPVLGLFLWRRWGLLHAGQALLACVAVLLALAVPFYVLDPTNFGPLLVQQKLKDLGGASSQIVALVLSATIASGLGILARDIRSLMLCCASALLVPVLFAVAQQSIAAARLDFSFYAWYGLSSTFFAACALMLTAVQEDARNMATSAVPPVPRNRCGRRDSRA